MSPRDSRPPPSLSFTLRTSELCPSPHLETPLSSAVRPDVWRCVRYGDRSFPSCARCALPISELCILTPSPPLYTFSPSRVSTSSFPTQNDCHPRLLLLPRSMSCRLVVICRHPAAAFLTANHPDSVEPSSSVARFFPRIACKISPFPETSFFDSLSYLTTASLFVVAWTHQLASKLSPSS